MTTLVNTFFFVIYEQPPDIINLFFVGRASHCIYLTKYQVNCKKKKENEKNLISLQYLFVIVVLART